jgi:hypothetical protein
MKNYAVAIEKWDFDYAQTVLAWLEENFGYRGTRWGIDHDFDLLNLWMNEDVYVLFLLKWK